VPNHFFPCKIARFSRSFRIVRQPQIAGGPLHGGHFPMVFRRHFAMGLPEEGRL